MNKTTFSTKNKRRNKIVASILVFLVLIVSDTRLSLAFSPPQDVAKDTLRPPLRPSRLEVPDDEYVPVPLEGRKTSPSYRFSTTGFFATQVNVDDSSRNIVGDAANEPSLAVDPTNPNRMAIGWRQFNTVTNNFRQAGYGYTTDGGMTWTFPGVLEPGIFRSDPVLDHDSEGSFYYNSLTVDVDFQCDVFKSTDGGATWDAGTFAYGGDKQWMAIDRTDGIGHGNAYAYWTSGTSVCFPGFFTRSVDDGASFENCVTIPDDPFWGTVAVGPDGELYVFGAGGNAFVLAKSSNAMDSSQTISWDFSTGVNLDGNIVAFAGNSSPNPSGLLGQAWVAVDHSAGPYRGYVYALCSVNRISTSDPLDVMFTRSTDGGLTWSSPVRVNDDPTQNEWQWFGTMSVAPNGRIDVIWLDTRDNPGDLNSSLYYSYSLDAGVTWSQNERLSESFDPHVGWPQQNKMGDYFHMVSNQTGAHLAWAATFNGEQDVYYGHIHQFVVTGADGQKDGTPQTFSLSQNYPNPFNGISNFEFRISKLSEASMKVYDLLGREVATLVNEKLEPGSYTRQWDARLPGGQASRFPSGVYFYRLKAGEYVATRKFVLLR